MDLISPLTEEGKNRYYHQKKESALLRWKHWKAGEGGKGEQDETHCAGIYFFTHYWYSGMPVKIASQLLSRLFLIDQT